MKHKLTKRYEILKIEGGNIIKTKKTCHRCGDGVYMADHKEKNGKTRSYCGKCHYTLWS